MAKEPKAPRAATRHRKQVLMIVESPAKGKTIEKYLGKGYTVAASMGHLIDLPKSRLAIDVEKSLRAGVHHRARQGQDTQGSQAEGKERRTPSSLHRIMTVRGRPSPSISRNALQNGTSTPDIQRITFNEITPKAIREAVANPGQIDMSKVNAQKARRVLDRIVGYYLSPLLWKKVKNGLSAGRVQSVALRMICEREAEIEAFLPEEYWSS